MLVQWLQCRETSRSKCGISTSKIISEVTRRNVLQSLSTFFPKIGSISSTIILGYSICGNFLVVLQHGSILVFSLVLSLKNVSIGPLHCNLKIRTSSEVASCPVVVEVILLKNNSNIISTLTVSVDECASQSKVICGRFRVFLSERLIIKEDTLSCTLRNNAMYPYGDNCYDAAVIINTGSSLAMYLVLHCKKSDLSSHMQKSATAFARLVGCNDLPSFSAKAKNWHSLSVAEHSNINRNGGSGTSASRYPQQSLTTVRSIVNLELFCDEYLHFLHPAAYLRGSHFDLEFRITGPTESGVEYLVTVGVSFTHTQAGLQSVGLLLLVNPLVDQIAVLKVCDLAALCGGRVNSGADFAAFRLQLRLKRAGEDLSWLSTAVDFYARIVRNSYDQTLFGSRNSSWGTNSSRNAVGDTRIGSNGSGSRAPYCVLSNINMLLNGESLTQLVHPFLPVIVVNDEEEMQNEEILFDSEEVY